jgi:hypothetical protein
MVGINEELEATEAARIHLSPGAPIGREAEILNGAHSDHAKGGLLRDLHSSISNPDLFR